MKYKVEFSKYREGQTMFSRSFTLSQIDVLFALCDEVEIKAKEKKKFGVLLMVFRGHKNVGKYVKVLDVPYYVLRKYLNVMEWKQL